MTDAEIAAQLRKLLNAYPLATMDWPLDLMAKAASALERATPALADAPKLRRALAELLEAFDLCPDDLDIYEYETIVDGAKAHARRLLREAAAEDAAEEQGIGCHQPMEPQSRRPANARDVALEENGEARPQTGSAPQVQDGATKTLWRKKPVVVQACRFDGTWTSVRALKPEPNQIAWIQRMALPNQLDIRTLEGTLTANVGDWIVKGIKGEFYPVRDDIFSATYAAVGEDRFTSLEPVTARKAAEHLESAFTWSESREGHDYWRAIFERLQQIENTPKSAYQIAREKADAEDAGAEQVRRHSYAEPDQSLPTLKAEGLNEEVKEEK